jgi:hypothetical protein
MSQSQNSRAADLPTAPRQKTFSVGLILLASIVGIYCVWLLISELTRPGVIRLPIDPQTAAAAAQKRAGAGWAARFGIVRGDLWAESGYTFADLLWKSSKNDPNLAQSLELARSRLDRAIRYAPTNAGVWLLLAGFATQLNDVTEALRMSYFTGPSDISLMPIRTFIAAQMPTLDADMQQLARRDVRLLLTHQQKSAIIQAYHVATTTGKRFIDQELNERDPNFAQALSRGAE